MLGLLLLMVGLSIEMVFGVLVFFFGSTLFFKKFFKAKTYFVASMIKTRKYNKLPYNILENCNNFLERISGKKNFFNKILDFVSDSGLVLGFGIFGFDYLKANKLNKKKRVLTLLLVFAFLFLFYSFTFGSQPKQNSFIKINETGMFLLQVFFALAGFLGFSIYAMVLASIDIITKILANSPACPGVAPVIPGIQVPRTPIMIPWFGWISFLLIIVIHEGFHALQIARQKLKLESTGLLFLGFLPVGAFVEPNEKELKNTENKKKMRVFSAGPSSNLYSIPFLILLFFGLLFVLNPLSQNINNELKNRVIGLQVTGVEKNIEYCNYTVESENFEKIRKGDIIIMVAGKPVKNLKDFFELYSKTRPGEYLETTIKKPSNEIRTELLKREEKTGRIGITLEESYNKDIPDTKELLFYREIISNILLFAGWTIILSILVGMFNFLPIAITDGAHMAPIIFASYLSVIGVKKEKAGKTVSIIFLALFLLLIALNALPYFFSSTA